jgi:hypothetical protein
MIIIIFTYTIIYDKIKEQYTSLIGLLKPFMIKI